MWDLDDGRCVNISSHAPFECSSVTVCRALTPNFNRFFAVAGKAGRLTILPLTPPHLGKGRSIEIFDVWKMRSIWSFKIDDRSSAVQDIQVVFEKKQIYCVDNKVDIIHPSFNKPWLPPPPPPLEHPLLLRRIGLLRGGVERVQFIRVEFKGAYEASERREGSTSQASPREQFEEITAHRDAHLTESLHHHLPLPG